MVGNEPPVPPATRLLTNTIFTISRLPVFDADDSLVCYYDVEDSKADVVMSADVTMCYTKNADTALPELWVTTTGTATHPDTYTDVEF